jgi:hypothetical protein
MFSRRPELEQLEDRTVPSTISWSNRGQASDGFAAAFGAHAAAARTAVDAAIDAWERTIVNFNYTSSGPVNTFALTIRVAQLGAGQGFLFTHDVNGNNQIDSAEVDGSGKPRSGLLTLSNPATTPGHPGWFIDPTPYESSEFMGPITNAFAGTPQMGSPATTPTVPGTITGPAADLLGHAVAGLGHLLGLSLTRSIAGNDLRLQTGGLLGNNPVGTDSVDFNGSGDLWTFHGPSVQALLTEDGSGQVMYVARPPNAVNGFQGGVDSGNPVLEDSARTLPSNLLALLLHDAYGYDIEEPEQFGTFYASFDSMGGLTVRGGAGSSVDVVTISLWGLDQVVSVDVNPDPPGVGPTDAYVSYFPIGPLRTISVSTGSGLDFVTLESNLGDSVVIDAGGDDDWIYLSPTLRNLDNLHGNLSIHGGSGYNQLFLDDSVKTGAVNYTLTATEVQGLAFATLVYDGVNRLELTGAASGNTITIAGRSGSMRVNGGGGDDTIIFNSVADPAHPLTIEGGGDMDTLQSLRGDNEWRVGSGQLRFNGEVIQFYTIESLLGGPARDHFILSATAPRESLRGSGGFDTLDYSSFTTGVVVSLANGSATGVGGGAAGKVSGIEIVLGGSGSDTLTGNGLANVLVGNGGGDVLRGGDGRDILIGGLRRDVLYGEEGDDLLIGGWTDHDGSPLRLEALMATWNHPTLPYEKRVPYLRYGVGPSRPYALNGTTVHDDSAVDDLFGDSGQFNDPWAGRDWFFAFPTDAMMDRAPDEQNG